MSRYQKGTTNLDFSEARDSEWQWHQLGRMQFCISLQTNNHASTPPLGFLQAGCPSCRPTNSVKALKAIVTDINAAKYFTIMADETTDFSRQEQLSVCLRYVKNFTIFERFLCFELAPDLTASGLAAQLLNILDAAGFNKDHNSLARVTTGLRQCLGSRTACRNTSLTTVLQPYMCSAHLMC